jgi:hypothetical protein
MLAGLSRCRVDFSVRPVMSGPQTHQIIVKNSVNPFEVRTPSHALMSTNLRR